MNQNLTPAQQQWYDLKQSCKDCILLFRLWDFYELFYEDAHIGHKVLWLTLTAKNKKNDNPIPMAWIPHHALEKYLPKLISAWYKVALAEQVWDVVPGSVVERKIVEIITPWTYIQENAFEQHIMSCWFWWDSNQQYHIAWWDFTLWTYFVQSTESFQLLCSIIEKIAPKEFVIHHSFPELESLSDFLQKSNIVYSVHDHPQDMDHFLKSILSINSLESFWEVLQWWSKHAVATLFSYVKHYQKKSQYIVKTIKKLWYADALSLDPVTIKNLEIFYSSYESNQEYSLFWVLNTNKTALWRRLLYNWLQFPTRNAETIKHRNDLIKHFSEVDTRERISWFLTWIGDIPRMISRLYYKNPSPNIVQNISKQLSYIFSHDELVLALMLSWLDEKAQSWLKVLKEFLWSAIQEESDTEKFWFIVSWFSTEVDSLRAVAFHSDDLLQEYLQDLQTTLRVNTLKIKRIKNQWYFLEVTSKDAQLLINASDWSDEKHDFVRTQSLKNATRFTTTYLSTIQEKIHDAHEALSTLEYKILDQIIEKILSSKIFFDQLSDAVALLDCSVSFAYRLLQWRTVPVLTDQRHIKIIWWRHPVVESFLSKDEQFISNDLHAYTERFFHCITWPNMWWKSTYLRQNAILLIMAHAWLPVPADSMEFYLLDGIYARVWSWDIIAKNQSTFMTEMVEMAYIIRNATEDSFIILDELWRWTSTYDWVALAQAISVYICHQIKAVTLFATHYHEIIELEDLLQWFYNASVSVYESWNNPIFLKKIVQWWASKSYWVDVAKLAWLPDDIIRLAQDYLTELEAWTVSTLAQWTSIPRQSGFDFWVISDKHSETLDAIHDLLDTVDINSITPLESMILLQKILSILQ